MEKAYLVLSDGTVFEGYSFGALVGAVGELVFTTGVVGYLETLTDAAYSGQIVVQTFPLIGNYGIIPEDLADRPRLSGYVVREWCEAPSNFRCKGTLSAYLKREGIPGICGVDTRALTRHLRLHGTMNAMITDTLPADADRICTYTVPSASELPQAEVKTYPADRPRFKVTLVDYGCASRLIPPLTQQGCTVTVVPGTACAKEILAAGPDGVILSGGPGDPARNPAAIAEIAVLAGHAPMLGIGLGHQMLALALGARTEKMHHGHRGPNQPVRDLQTNRCYTTEQNHGFAVAADSVSAGKIRYENVNDGSCEGIDYPDIRAFSVQFDPMRSQDPNLFLQRFFTQMGGDAECRVI